MSDLEIEGFRGIRTGKLADLGPLTLLVGPNCSGKSTALEALYVAQGTVYRGPHHPLERIANRRGWLGTHTASTLVPSGSGRLLWSQAPGSPPRTIRLKSSGGSSLQISLESAPQTNTWSVEVAEARRRELADELVEPTTSFDQPELLEESFSLLERQGLLKEVLGLLEPLLPGIADLKIIKLGDRYVLHVIDGDGPAGRWPAAAAGDGLKRLLLLAGRLAALQPPTTVLLEEPEVHLHPRAIGQLASLFWRAVGRGLRLVAATHSLELLDALVEPASDADLDKLTVFRLALRSGELRAVRVPGVKVRELRHEISEDLRR